LSDKATLNEIRCRSSVLVTDRCSPLLATCNGRSSELAPLLCSLKETLSEGELAWINSLLFALEYREELDRIEDQSASICHLLERLT